MGWQPTSRVQHLGPLGAIAGQHLCGGFALLSVCPLRPAGAAFHSTCVWDASNSRRRLFAEAKAFNVQQLCGAFALGSCALRSAGAALRCTCSPPQCCMLIKTRQCRYCGTTTCLHSLSAPCFVHTAMRRSAVAKSNSITDFRGAPWMSSGAAAVLGTRPSASPPRCPVPCRMPLPSCQTASPALARCLLPLPSGLPAGLAALCRCSASVPLPPLLLPVVSACIDYISSSF